MSKKQDDKLEAQLKEALNDLDTKEVKENGKEGEKKEDKKPEEELVKVDIKKPKLLIGEEAQKKASPRRGRPRKKKEPEPEQLITGETLLFVTDVFASRVLALIHNMLMPKEKKVSWAELSLDAEERENCRQIADKAASRIALQGDPLIIFGVTMLIIYVVKLVARE